MTKEKDNLQKATIEAVTELFKLSDIYNVDIDHSMLQIMQQIDRYPSAPNYGDKLHSESFQQYKHNIVADAKQLGFSVDLDERGAIIDPKSKTTISKEVLLDQSGNDRMEECRAARDKAVKKPEFKQYLLDQNGQIQQESNDAYLARYNQYQQDLKQYNAEKIKFTDDYIAKNNLNLQTINIQKPKAVSLSQLVENVETRKNKVKETILDIKQLEETLVKIKVELAELGPYRPERFAIRGAVPEVIIARHNSAELLTKKIKTKKFEVIQFQKNALSNQLDALDKNSKEYANIKTKHDLLENYKPEIETEEKVFAEVKDKYYKLQAQLKEHQPDSKEYGEINNTMSNLYKYKRGLDPDDSVFVDTVKGLKFSEVSNQPTLGTLLESNKGLIQKVLRHTSMIDDRELRSQIQSSIIDIVKNYERAKAPEARVFSDKVLEPLMKKFHIPNQSQRYYLKHANEPSANKKYSNFRANYHRKAEIAFAEKNMGFFIEQVNPQKIVTETKRAVIANRLEQIKNKNSSKAIKLKNQLSNPELAPPKKTNLFKRVTQFIGEFFEKIRKPNTSQDAQKDFDTKIENHLNTTAKPSVKKETIDPPLKDEASKVIKKSERSTTSAASTPRKVTKPKGRVSQR